MQGILIELALPEDASQKQKDAADWLCGIIRKLNGAICLPQGSWKISGKDEDISLEYFIAPKEKQAVRAFDDVLFTAERNVLNHRILQAIEQYVQDLEQRFCIAIGVYIIHPKVCRRNIPQNVVIVDDTDDAPRKRKLRRTKKRVPRKPSKQKEEEE